MLERGWACRWQQKGCEGRRGPHGANSAETSGNYAGGVDAARVFRETQAPWGAGPEKRFPDLGMAEPWTGTGFDGP